MDVNKLKDAGIDYEEGLRRFAGKTELFEKFLREFFKDDNFNKLGDFLEKGDFEKAFRCAHTLKGMSGNLSIKAFYVKDCQLVELLRNGKNENLEELYQEMSILYYTAEKAVNDENIKKFQNFEKNY